MLNSGFLAVCGAMLAFSMTCLTGVAQGSRPGYREVVLADHPIAYYRLDEASGAVAHDSSGHHLDGRIGARVGRVKPGLIADDAASLEFDGANRSSARDVVRVPGNRMFERAHTVTIEAWVYPYDIGVYGENSGNITLVAYGNDDAPDELHCRYALELDAHSHIFHFPAVIEGKTTAPARVTGFHSLLAWIRQPFSGTERTVHMLYAAPGGEANPPAPKKRYHLVGTYDGEMMRFYVDGMLDNELAVRGSIVGYAARNGMGIGGEYIDLNPVFHGRIGEVAVYATTLTAAQIARHYEAGIADTP
jgi:hypothetical protein